MKKAKQYIIEIKDIDLLSEKEYNSKLFDFYKEFLNEGAELSEIRGDSDKVMIGIFSELDTKWKSIASKTPFLNANGFRNTIMDDMPSVKKLMGWSRND